MIKPFIPEVSRGRLFYQKCDFEIFQNRTVESLGLHNKQHLERAWQIKANYFWLLSTQVTRLLACKQLKHYIASIT